MGRAIGGGRSSDQLRCGGAVGPSFSAMGYGPCCGDRTGHGGKFAAIASGFVRGSCLAIRRCCLIDSLAKRAGDRRFVDSHCLHFVFPDLGTAGATNLSLVTFLVPISATVLGVGLLGETIGVSHILGL